MKGGPAGGRCVVSKSKKWVSGMVVVGVIKRRRVWKVWREVVWGAKKKEVVFDTRKKKERGRGGRGKGGYALQTSIDDDGAFCCWLNPPTVGKCCAGTADPYKLAGGGPPCCCPCRIAGETWKGCIG